MHIRSVHLFGTHIRCGSWTKSTYRGDWSAEWSRSVWLDDCDGFLYDSNALLRGSLCPLHTHTLITSSTEWWTDRTGVILDTSLSRQQTSLLLTCVYWQPNSLPRQGIHRHQTPPWYRNAASHTLPYSPLWPNVMSSIKPEVHNVSQRRQKRNEPWPQGICTTNFIKIGPTVSEICSRTNRQTDRQADHNTPLPYRGGVITI